MMSKRNVDRRLALVTGATAGIGEAVARRFAAEDWDLVLTGRRSERLIALSQELVERCPQVSVLALTFDVCDEEATFAALEGLSEDWQSVDVLVNNAGLSQSLEPVHRQDPADWDRMIDTNIKGLLRVSRVVAPWMRRRGRGHIINLGSIAGKEVYANGAVYCATKHAVEAITRSMRMELNPDGIKVGLIAPGLVETEFSIVRFKGDRERAAAVYHGLEPLVADDIADAVWYMASRPAHVHVADMLILPTAQASMGQITRRP
ncbi:MAG: SDR family NAD(P)-dependent oxidoreductase [Bacteroidia bacterium]|jgi:NADP-dependent 3-hydroxy acid dehydrogenase YdfG